MSTSARWSMVAKVMAGFVHGFQGAPFKTLGACVLDLQCVANRHGLGAIVLQPDPFYPHHWEAHVSGWPPAPDEYLCSVVEWGEYSALVDRDGIFTQYPQVDHARDRVLREAVPELLIDVEFPYPSVDLRLLHFGTRAKPEGKSPDLEPVPMDSIHVPFAEFSVGSESLLEIIAPPRSRHRVKDFSEACAIAQRIFNERELPLPLMYQTGGGAPVTALSYRVERKPEFREGYLPCDGEGCRGSGQVALFMSVETCGRCGGSGWLRAKEGA